MEVIESRRGGGREGFDERLVGYLHRGHWEVGGKVT